MILFWDLCEFPSISASLAMRLVIARPSLQRKKESINLVFIKWGLYALINRGNQKLCMILPSQKYIYTYIHTEKFNYIVFIIILAVVSLLFYCPLWVFQYPIRIMLTIITTVRTAVRIHPTAATILTLVIIFL